MVKRTSIGVKLAPEQWSTNGVGVFDANGDTIARITHRPECVAHAKLMRAAPEMARLLAKIEQFWVEVCEIPEDDEDLVEMRRILTEVRSPVT